MRKYQKNFESFETKKVGKEHPGMQILKSTIIKNAFPLSLIFIGTLIFTLSAFTLPKAITYDIDTSNAEQGVENAKEVALDPKDSNIRIFREYGEKIGVFYKDGELDFLIDVKISSLSDYDRELLSKGIIADGSEEIAMLIEGLTEFNK